jgi:hypothetical protein
VTYHDCTRGESKNRACFSAYSEPAGHTRAKEAFSSGLRKAWDSDLFPSLQTPETLLRLTAWGAANDSAGPGSCAHRFARKKRPFQKSSMLVAGETEGPAV